MAGPNKRVEKAETEAAAWHVRLGRPDVTPQTIKEFFAWRQAPAHADAYRRVEQVWGQSARLAGDPALSEALRAASARKSGSRRGVRTRGPLIGGVAIAAGLAVVFGSWTWLDAKGLYTTGVGEQWLVQLADGSSVRLDTDTRLRVRFDEGRRLLELERGQALFTVAHDAARPFVVQAGNARVTAVGTVFDVEREGEGASVTLVSGVVDVGAGERRDAVRRMRAGQHAVVTAAGSVVKSVDAASETSWTEGRLVFRDTPLAEAVGQVNRYLTDKIVLEAGSLETGTVNGVFKTGDRDAFVSTAAEVFGLQASSQPDGTVRLSVPGK